MKNAPATHSSRDCVFDTSRSSCTKNSESQGSELPITGRPTPNKSPESPMLADLDS